MSIKMSDVLSWRTCQRASGVLYVPFLSFVKTNDTKENQSNREKIKSSIQPYIRKIAKIFGNHKANSKLDHVHLGFISNRYNESF